jgi:hypothetical protein
MLNRLATLATAAVTLLALALLAGCGGDDSSGSSSDTDPQQVLDAALGSESEPIGSGVLDISFDLDSSGESAGALSATVQGPFQSGDDQLPQLDLTANANVDAQGLTLDFDGGLTVTGDGLFVSYNGTDYQLDDQTFALLQQSYEQSSQLQQDQDDQGSLSAFGIDPSTWISNLTNEGTEDVDGTEVVHVSGSANVPQISKDLQTVAEQTGQASQSDIAGLQQLQDLVTDASIDVYADAEDSTLRKLDLSLEIADPAGGDTTSVTLSIGIADPNSDQEITAPEDAQPIADLLGQIPGGADALGGLAGGSAPSGGAAAGGAPENYYDCAAKAKTASDLEECAALVAP